MKCPTCDKPMINLERFVRPIQGRGMKCIVTVDQYTCGECGPIAQKLPFIPVANEKEGCIDWVKERTP